MSLKVFVWYRTVKGEVPLIVLLYGLKKSEEFTGENVTSTGYLTVKISRPSPIFTKQSFVRLE